MNTSDDQSFGKVDDTPSKEKELEQDDTEKNPRATLLQSQDLSVSQSTTTTMTTNDDSINGDEHDDSDDDDNHTASVPSCTDHNKTPPSPLYPPQRTFSTEQMEILNVLVHPVWIFDIDHRQMAWANEPALALWNSTSLSELTSRNFGDMSEATITRLQANQEKFRKGQYAADTWTIYPKGEPKTVHLTCSGVRLSPTAENPSMLVEALPVNNIDPQMLRGVEMLRHEPVPVAQFDLESAQCMYENAEATLMRSSKSTRTKLQYPEEQQEEETKTHEPSTTDGQERQCSIHVGFVERFVDSAVGRKVLSQLQKSTDHNFTLHLEAMIKTKHGPRWSAVQLRKTSDPVTGKPVFLYSSKDMSDAIQARKEKEARIKKSEFLAIMAHEIRTPLHQVTGFIDLLGTTTLDSEQQSYVKQLMSSAHGLMTVINDVLDYSKLEAGKMKLECIPYEPLSVVEGCLGAVRAGCDERGLYLDLDWDRQLPFRVMGDPNRLRQILLNLLSNAMKFTTRGGIHVSVLDCHQRRHMNDNESSPMIKFVVKDTGIGISDEHKDLIFQQYQQGNASVARNFGGTGLGLSICKLLVENMGGSIGMTSQEHEGSSFWFTLPSIVPAENLGGEVNTIMAASGPHESSLHILVAEDNKVNQKLLAKMLSRMGHTFDIAENGKVAVEMTQTKPYDAILME